MYQPFPLSSSPRSFSASPRLRVEVYPVPPRSLLAIGGTASLLYVRKPRRKSCNDSKPQYSAPASWAASTWKAFAGWASSTFTPSAKAAGEKAAAAGRRVPRRQDRLRLPPDPGRSGRGCRARVHAQRPALPDGHGRAPGRQARDLREAPGDLGGAGARTGGAGRARPGAATARSTICAFTRMVQQMRRMREAATWARSWWCRAPTRRTGCSTTRIGTGAWIPRPTAPRAAWPTSARTGATWRSTSPGCASRRLCADLQTFHKTRKRPKGPVETFAGKTAEARGLRSKCRSTPRISAR